MGKRGGSTRRSRATVSVSVSTHSLKPADDGTGHPRFIVAINKHGLRDTKMKQFTHSFTRYLCCTVLIFSFLSAVNPAKAAEISYVGSSTVGKFMHAAVDEYKASSFKINTKPESGGGENATAAGKVDLGGVAREVKPEILARNVEKFLIGRDAIAILVNAGNPVSELSMAQLKGIFTGEITNWSEVGGKDLAINVYIVNPQSATRKVFAKVVLDGASYNGDRLQTIRPDPAVADKVAADEGGIGQLSFALVGDQSGLKRLRPDGQEASVNNPEYPITRPLYLITKGEPAGEVKAFINWALSDAGQAVVKQYFVGS